MPNYTVTAAEEKKKFDGKYGPMVVFTLRLKGSDGIEHTAEWLTKATTPLPATGTSLEGDLEDGQYGKSFKKAKPANGFSGGGMSPERQAAVQRQHSQEMAIRAVALLTQEVKPTTDALRASIREWTDWFDADVNQASPNASQDGGANPPSLPASSSSAGPSEPATPPQKRAMTNALRKMQCGDDLPAAIVHKAAGNPPTKTGASGLLDVLNEPGATLEGVCERVGVPIPTDLPAPDTRDLPPMQPPVDAVVGDAEGIPF
jgi:hypothetical protein